jgi:hypothetical protein
MAKSSRASSKKFNNQRKAATIFGPAEAARQERLSAKLLELARQAKPEPAEMKIDGEFGQDGSGIWSKIGTGTLVFANTLCLQTTPMHRTRQSKPLMTTVRPPVHRLHF